MDYSSPMKSDAQRKQLLDADPDLPLLQAMAKKDSSALEELYRRHGPRLLAYLSARLEDVGLAEEVLQDVMLSAWQNASRFRGECRVVTWLMAIARNRAINAFHRKLSALGSKKLVRMKAFRLLSWLYPKDNAKPWSWYFFMAFL